MRATEVASTREETGLYVSERSTTALADGGVLTPRMRRRRAFALVLLTLVLPGSAQLVAGRRDLGRFALRVWGLVVGVCLLVGVVFLVQRSLALSLFSRGAVLTFVESVFFALAALWALLFLDAWRLGQPTTLVVRARRWLTAITAVLLVMTSGSLVYAASNVGAGRDALDSMFQGTTAAKATKGRYNILVLGGDSGADRVGTRPDSIQLVSVDATTGRAVTFGFSRDTENINFRPGSTMKRLMPAGWNCGDQCLLNGLFTWATDHKAMFPPGTRDPGVLATREAVEALSGLDVQYFVLIDLRGFSGLIDALGGLDVNVQKRTPIGGGTSRISGWIEPGLQHLDGTHALWYARAREGSSNYDRMARQRCVMTAMVQQVDPQALVLHFAGIAAATKGVLKTDLPQSELGYFADLALKTRAQKIKSVNFVPPLIKPWHYDPAIIRSTVASTIQASEDGTSASESVARKAAAGSASAARSGTTAGTPSAATPAPDASVGTPSAPANAKTTDLGGICSAG
ncbi:LCP family protein required for cell wall assembly [Phycicoccus badiiscoriae]|uniref:LCP family protein required for cell wall assembly n=1 Tax=Pedococcus badiiscoriae TaxID=642776 RepID=A0A852WFS9_9MICO|nr:LCP family protein [Pedococcus badiiscoriae]NYG07630.1 LCP family protein required for cell wall assembly [Pedococcus badiiscoriae]